MSYLGVYGHVVLDYIFQVSHLPEPNTSIQVSESTMHFGGTGGNIARAAARLGVKTSLASFVGEDFPSDYQVALESDGIDLTDLRFVKGAKTPRAWIFTEPEGNQVAIIDQGPMAEASHLELQEHTVRDSEVVHIATGRPEYYRQVVELAVDLGKKVAFDPSQEIHYVYTAESFRQLLSMSDIFFCNQKELGQALKFLDLGGVKHLQRNVGVVVLTKGKEGSVIYAEETSWRIPSVPPLRVVDPTGAGDAYRGGFYAGMMRGKDLPLCGLLGASVASFSIEGSGPQGKLPSWKEAWERAEPLSSKVLEIHP